MWASAVVQRDDGTPTGPKFESFYIRGTPGQGGLSIFMDWLPRVVPSSAAAFRVRCHAALVHGSFSDHSVGGLQSQ